MSSLRQGRFSSGLRKSDVEQALGDDFAAHPEYLPAGARGHRSRRPAGEVKPGNKITQQLKKLIAPAPPKAAASPKTQAEPKKLNLAPHADSVGRIVHE